MELRVLGSVTNSAKFLVDISMELSDDAVIELTETTDNMLNA